MRCKNGFDLGHNWALETKHNYLVITLDATINQHAINGSSVSFNHLHLHHCASENVLLHLNTFTDAGKLSWVLDNDCKQVRNSFTSYSWSWYETDVLGWVFIFPVQSSIVALSIELENDLTELVLIIIDCLLRLLLEGEIWRRITIGFPVVGPINLIQSNHKGSIALWQ